MSNRTKITVWLIATSLPLGVLITVVSAWGAPTVASSGSTWLRAWEPPGTGRIEEIAVGWPMRSLQMWAAQTGRDHPYRGLTDEVRYRRGLKVHLLPVLGSDSYQVLPLRPIWLGFAADVLSWSSVIAIYLFTFTIVPTRLRGTGHCAECRYDLSHIESTCCPECGTPRGRRWRLYKPSWAWRSALCILLAYSALIGLVIVGAARVEHWSPIHQAAKFGDLDFLRAELATGIDVDLPLDVSGPFLRNATPLHVATITSQPEVVHVLITAGADVNAPLVSRGMRPIDLAIRVQSVEVLHLLLNAGASTSPNMAAGGVLLEQAHQRGGHDLTRLLLSREDDPAAAAQRLLRLWCSGQHPLTDEAAIGRMLVEFGADVQGTMPDGTPLLLEAAQHSQSSVIGFLIEQGVDVNLRDEYNRTSLMYVSQRGGYGAAAVLIEAGADTSLRDRDGQTALDMARDALENSEDVSSYVIYVIELLEQQAREESGGG